MNSEKQDCSKLQRVAEEMKWKALLRFIIANHREKRRGKKGAQRLKREKTKIQKNTGREKLLYDIIYCNSKTNRLERRVFIFTDKLKIIMFISKGLTFDKPLHLL